MPGATTKFAIPFPIGADAVQAALKTVVAALADRVDYMLGESGDSSITPSAANTKTTRTINFSRTYKTPPRVVVGLGRDGAVVGIAPGVISLWVDDVSTTQVVIACQRTSVTDVQFTWHAKPASTDVTP